LIIRENGDMDSKRDRSNYEDMPPLKDYTSEEITYLVEAEALIIRRILQVQVKKDDIDQQKKNIFQTFCHIQNKVCNLIV
jgi:hypothetical protein